jgi:two-component system cell cycle sensor histidine kinase/response regulator CckA
MDGGGPEEKGTGGAELELRSLLDALPDIYFRLDADARFLAWHAGSQAELHVPPEQFLGKRAEEVLPPDVAAQMATSVERALRERTLVIVEYTLETPSGDDQFEARFVPCGPNEVTAVIRNTTAQRRAEAALRASEEQLRASQKMEAIGRLAGGVAHDFNNLLTVILGRLQFLHRAADLAPSDRSHVSEALDAAGRAASLTRQLMALARRQVMQPLVFSLNEVIVPMLEIVRRIVGEDVEVALELQEEAGSIRADKTQIEQVILNLVLNARDAMSGGGRLVIATRAVWLDEEQARLRDGAAEGMYEVLSVADSGSGMPPEVIAHLFEPFFTTKGPGEGTGLGLATTYGIVKQSGGHAVVRSQVGAGSTFELYFPRAQEAVIAEEGSRPSLVPPLQNGGSETILLVEDDDGLRRLVAEVLSGAGYHVAPFADGEEALGAIQNGLRGALLVADVVMPKLSGRALASVVRQRHSETRVLLMSGHDVKAPRHADGAVGGEAVSILEKPFSPQTLLRRVREALEGRGRYDSQRLAVSPSE